MQEVEQIPLPELHTTTPPATAPENQTTQILLAISRNNNSSNTYKKGGVDTKSPAYRMAFAPLAQTPPPVPVNKYHSIHSLEESKKIDALKDPKLNPNLIEDGYDQLAHGFHLWTTVGAKAKASGNISFDEQKTIASNFYDAILAPAYGHINKDSGMVPMSKDLWMKQAYEEALNYKIENAYTNDWTSSLKHGWNSALAQTARAADRVTTILGNGYRDVVAQFRKEAAYGAVGPDQASYQNWIQRSKEIDTQLALDKKYDTNAVQRGARYQDTHRQFWADALPAHDGFLNKATSFVAEQAGQLPIYAAMSLGGEAAAVPGKAIGLTDMLNASPVGKRVAGYLMAGAEGLAYGAATRKQDDPGEKWRDMVGFAVFHGLFDVGGSGLKKLIDLVPKEDIGLLDRLKARQDAYMLAQEGKRSATPVEVYDDHKTEVANNIFVGGIPAQRAIFVDALHHISETENMSRAEVKAYQAKLLEQDPARWAPVLSSAKFVRSLLGSKKLSDIEPGSENEQFLSSRIARLIIDASSEMNTRVHNMSEEFEAKAPQTLQQPAARHTLQYYVDSVKSDLAKSPGASKMVTQEQILKTAQIKYAADLEKAAQDSEKETGVSKTEKAQNIANRRKSSAADIELRTRRSKPASGGKQISVQAVPYKVRLAQHAKAAKAKGQSLGDYFHDLDDQDFQEDLSQYFYPPALRKAKVFFEHQNTKEGMQNPNFLAFMYNYTSQMPKEFSAALKEKLIDTMKVQKYMSGKIPTDPQLSYYAAAMYNHMDNLLGSGRWPAEHNIFRTSNESIFKTTKWQRQLLIEKTLQEQTNLKDMFSGEANKKAQRLALATHRAFSQLRMSEFDKAHPKRNSQEHIKAYDDLIAELQTFKGSGYNRWKF